MRNDTVLLGNATLHVFVSCVFNFVINLFCSVIGHHRGLVRVHGIGFAAVRPLHTGDRKCKGHKKQKLTLPPPRNDGSKGTSMANFKVHANVASRI